MARPPQDSSVAIPKGRSRLLWSGFFQDEVIMRLAPLDRLFFAGLFCFADRAGRVLDRPLELKQRISAADDLDTDAALNRIAKKGLLRRYRVGKLRVIAINEQLWAQTQSCHPNEPFSGLPPPPAVVPRASRNVPVNQNTLATRVSQPVAVAGSSVAGSSVAGSSVRGDDVIAASMWDQWESKRVDWCEDRGIEPGKQQRPSSQKILERLSAAVAHLGLKDEPLNDGTPFTKWEQLEMVFEFYLVDDFAKDRSPPWAIDFFLSEGVLKTQARKCDRWLDVPEDIPSPLAVLPWSSARKPRGVA